MGFDQVTWLIENVQLLGTATNLLSGGMAAAADAADYELQAINAEARAQSDRFNAEVAEQQAKSERQGALADAEDFRRIQSSRMATSRASQAASGFTMEGSPMLVNEATMTEIEFSVGRILRQGEVRATRLEQQAQLDRFSAGVEDQNAGYARQAKTMSVFSNAVSSFGSAVSNIKPTLVNGSVSFG